MWIRKMPSEALKDLQDAVGEDNASADPGMIQAYTYMNSGGSALSGVWMISPIGVVLPSSVEEVQAVQRACKKHGLKIKPQSTAWFPFSVALGPNVVIMDLRRMDGLEINVQDGYAIVEPYCTAGEQQVEIMKLGMNSHVNGAGPNASNLASATSCQGSGGTSQSMSNSERNCLGVEFCLNNGEEVLYMGSPGTPNAGWFCGDGPGPSLRGMMRGAIGNLGTHGVYTKCAMKCYPWASKPFHCEGSPPFFDAEPLENYTTRIGFWPDWDSECDALYLIGEAELVDYCARMGPGAFEECVSCSNEEYMSMVESKIYRNTFPKGAQTFSIAASCKEEFDARLKTLEKIVEDTNGILIDPIDLGKDTEQITFLTAIRGCYIFKAAFMPTGSWSVYAPMSYETIDNMWKINQPINCKVKQYLIEQEAIEDDYYDNVYSSTDEHSHFGHVESPYHVDLWEPKGCDVGGLVWGCLEGMKKHVPLFYTPIPTEGDGFAVYAKYMGKIYNLLDPSRVSDNPIANIGLRNRSDIDELKDKEGGLSEML